jgi:uncharacterized protein
VKKNQLPLEIDPFALAQKKSSLSGSYKLGSFQRLKTLVKNPDLQAEFSLQFERDDQGFSVIHGSIHVGVDLICERCGELVHFDFQLSPRLGLALTENKARDLPEEYEPVVTNGLPVPLASLVEDEILLAMPMIPKHEFGTCSIE